LSSSPTTGWRPTTPKRALEATIAAGDASLTVYAYAEAARQFERAIDLWDDVPATDRPPGHDLGDLYDAAGAAAALAGDATRGINLARRAIELIDGAAAPDGDLERRARARDRLGFAAMLAGDTATSIKLLEEAVALLADAPPTLAQARALAGLSANLMLAGRAAESLPYAERAIESARTIGARGIESRALNVLGVDRAALGDIGGGIDLLRQSLAIADPVADPSLIPRGHANLSTVLEMGGFDEEAVEVSLAGTQSIDPLRQRPRFQDLPRGQRRDVVDRARPVSRGRGTARRQPAARSAGHLDDPALPCVRHPRRPPWRPGRGHGTDSRPLAPRPGTSRTHNT